MSKRQTLPESPGCRIPASQQAAICRDGQEVMSPLVVRPTCLWTLPALLYDDHGKDEATREIGTACDENRLHCITASEGTSDLMRFHAKYVSASEAGDYYQVSFDTEDPGEDSTDPRGPDRPYLIIQRQFETLDGGQCYVETHDHGYIGHFHVRLTNFTRTCLAFEIARKRNTYVEVSCSLDAVEFKEVQRIVNIIFDQHG
jgi:hypothetical protein